MNSPSGSHAAASGVESSHLGQGLLLALWTALWMAAEGLMTSRGLGDRAQVGILLLAFCGLFGGAGLRWGRRLSDLLTSLSFAVSQVSFLALGVAVGVALPQDPSRYPRAQAFGLADPFHSLWFTALFALLAISMLAVAWKRRPYPLARVGFLMVHAAPAVALVGVLWGQIGGIRARAELKVGEGTGTFQRLGGGKSDNAAVLPGFQVRLERFEARRRGTEARLLASVPGTGKGAASPRFASLPMVEGRRGQLLDTGLEYEVERFIPRAVAFGSLPVPPVEARDPEALVVLLGVGSPEPLLGTLYAFGEAEFRKDEPLGRFAVLFREQLDGPLLSTLRPCPARVETLVATLEDSPREVPVRVGERLQIGDTSLKVRAVYPDFQVRPDARGNPVMSSRSAEPRDPWLEVELTRPGGPPRRVLLSAREPDYSDRLNAANLPPGLRLRYLRTGGETLRRFVVFSRVERRVALVESGAVVREGTWDLNRPYVVEPGLSVTPVGLFDRFYPAPPGLEPQAVPALRVKVVDPQAALSERAWLPADGRNKAFFEGRVSLSLQEDLDPRGFRSTLVLVDTQGRELARQVVGLNEPLVYGGLTFRQSPHPSQDPQTSVLLVVAEPGIRVVWFACGMLVLGVAWMFYLKPWLKGRAQGGGR